MIYTVTVSPSLDYYMPLAALKKGEVNRAENCRFEVGGKGLNIAKTISALGGEVCAFGFTAGFVGDEIERLCRLQNIPAQFSKLSSGNSRINVKIAESSADCGSSAGGSSADGSSADESSADGSSADGVFTMTEINAPATDFDVAAMYDYRFKLDTIEPGDFLVLSGSVPKNSGIYILSASVAAERRAKVVVDCEGETLKSVLRVHPFLIKPNHYELCSLWGEPPTTDRAVLDPLLDKTLDFCENILLSLGGEGALLASNNAETLFVPAQKGEVKNTVGAGDTLLAGFLYAFVNGKDRKESLDFAAEMAAEKVFGKRKENL
jgi:1-phosphofructokinase